MSDYKYDNPDDAYQEALRRIEKAKDESATTLDLRELGLTAVPPEIERLTELRELVLYGNRLTAITFNIGQLTELVGLWLGKNRFATVPSQIMQLTKLKRLYLHENQLKIIPREIRQLIELTMLGLNKNQLTAVPPEIGLLTTLEELDLSYNRLTIIPPEIGLLTTLEKFYLYNNKLIVIPPEIGLLTELRWLSFSNNQLMAIPSEITQLTNLKELWLEGNPDLSIPPEIVAQKKNAQAILGYLQALSRIKKAQDIETTRLDLSRLDLTSVPPEIGQLTELMELYLEKNQLDAIPPEIGQLNTLRLLWLYENQLAVVPPEIEQLKKLQNLALQNNRLTTIPSEIGQLKLLTRLSLENNQITTIPPEIGQLTRLEKLWLDNNLLTDISPKIAQLTNLRGLWLKGNPDLLIPPEILAQEENAQAILDYLRERQSKLAHPLNEAKLILVGQGGVGKTSLVKRLMGQGFDEAENQTEGINIESWSLDVDRPQQGTVPIALNIWDFGGQEIMHATHQFFLTQRSLYLLVLDARQGEDEGRVEYWLSLIHSFAPAAPVLIVINKSDQHHLDINRRGLQQKYPAVRRFIRTSARAGTGLDKLKTEIATLLASMDHVDSPFPASWMQVKQTLTAMQAEHDTIPYSAYQQLCRDSGITEASSQQTLIRFLHDLGIVLNFDDDRVHDTNVLNPNWITQGIYALLNHPDLQKQHGLLRHNQLQNFLPAAAFPTAAQRRFVREMMLKFELAFEINRQTMLIPDLISKEQPAFAWNDADALQFAYQYSVLPHSILHRFMVRQHHRIDPVIRWHTGVMLHQDGYFGYSQYKFTALVKADIKAATIRISIAGDGDRRQFLYSLRLEFAGIHETISGTKPQEVVPIPGHPTAPPVGYDYLEQLEKMKMETVPHAAPNGEVIMLNVQELLNGVSTSAMRQAGLPTRSQLLADLRRAFDESEFDDLLFDLNVDEKDIAGDSTADKMRELIKHMERRESVPDLVAAIGQKRPSLDL